MAEPKVLTLDDMKGEKEEINLQAENNQLKASLYQIDILYKNYVVLCMIMMQRSGEDFVVSEEELNAMKESGLGLKVESNEEEETATFKLIDMSAEDTTEEDDDSKPNSEEDIQEQVQENGEGDLE